MTGLPPLAVARVWAWAAALRPLKHVVPLGTLVRWVRARPSGARSRAFERALESFMTPGGPFPWRAPGNCLERSLAIYRLLCRGGASPEIVVGVRRAASGGVEGHVWLAVDGLTFGEPRGALDGYVAVVRYDADARPHVQEGSAPDLSEIRLA